MKASKSILIRAGLVMLLAALVAGIMASSASASFDSNRPDLSVSKTSVYWGSYADYTARQLSVDFSVSNASAAVNAYGVTVDGAPSNNGVTVVTPTPAAVGDIMASSSGAVALKYQVPDGVTGFMTNLQATAHDTVGSGFGYPASGSSNLAYIENTGGSGVTPAIDVLDMNSMSLTDSYSDTSLTGAAQSHLIAVSPDGKYIWHSVQPGDATTGYVEVLDTATGAQVKRWDVGSANGPHMDATWTRGGDHFVFITGNKPGMVGINVFDVEKMTYVGLIPEAGTSTGHIMDITADGNTLWHTNGSNVVKFDISGLPSTLPTTPAATIPLGGSLHAIVVTRDGRYVIAGSSTLGGVNIIDTSTNTVVATKAGGIGTAHNMTISPDGNTLLVGETGAYTCSGSVDPSLPHDGTVGPFLWFVDISTLNTATPDFSTVVVTDRLDSRSVGPVSAISHQVWSPDGSKILVSTYGIAGGSYSAGNGQLLVLDPNTHALDNLLVTSPKSHGIAYAGYAR